MAGFVGAGEVRDAAGHGVGEVAFEDAEERNERAFAHRGEQEAGFLHGLRRARLLDFRRGQSSSSTCMQRITPSSSSQRSIVALVDEVLEPDVDETGSCAARFVVWYVAGGSPTGLKCSAEEVDVEVRVPRRPEVEPRQVVVVVTPSLATPVEDPGDSCGVDVHVAVDRADAPRWTASRLSRSPRTPNSRRSCCQHLALN